MRALLDGLKRNLPYIAENLPELPQLAFKALDRIARDDLHLKMDPAQIESIREDIRRANRRSIRAIIGGSLVVSASVILGLDGIAPIMVGKGGLLVPLMAVALLLPGLYLLISSRYDD